MFLKMAYIKNVLMKNIPIRKKDQMYRNRPESVKPKIRGHKLRQNVNLQGALKQKGVKQGLGVLCWENWPCHTLENDIRNELGQ
jgi:hypothetical protein